MMVQHSYFTFIRLFCLFLGREEKNNTLPKERKDVNMNG